MIQFTLPDNVLDETPDLHPDSFIASGAQVMGNVILKQDSSVWYNSVLRGDINRIEVGKRSNIQDGCILHIENNKPCIVGNDVTVGHHVNLHGCTIGDGCLIGIGAIVLSGAKIGKGCIIGAGAVVKEGAEIPDFSMVVGVPGKIIKTLPDPDTHMKNQISWAQKYVQLSRIHKTKFGNNTPLYV